MQPPLSFQPQTGIPSISVERQVQPARSTVHKSEGQDLITRYNLGSRIAAGNDNTSSFTPSSPRGWSQNKDERHRLLHKRRDDMILAARRRLMQKDGGGD